MEAHQGSGVLTFEDSARLGFFTSFRQFTTSSRDHLQTLAQPLEWHDYPMEHSVCAEEVKALNLWLLRVLA